MKNTDYRMFFVKYSVTGYRSATKVTNTIYYNVGILKTNNKTNIPQLVEAERIKLEKALTKKSDDDILIRAKTISIKTKKCEYLTTDTALIKIHKEEEWSNHNLQIDLFNEANLVRSQEAQNE
jgi:hypothetical protein